MAEKNPVLSTLLALTGDRNTITLHVSIVDFCDGDIEIALFLEQMLYWTPRSSNYGWVSKSAGEWYDEIRVSRYAIEKAVKLFHVGNDKKPAGRLPMLQTMLKKFNGSPTIHYKLDTEKLAILWSEWLESANGFGKNSKSNLPNPANPNVENSNSLTESTSKTMSESKSPLLEKETAPVSLQASSTLKQSRRPKPKVSRPAPSVERLPSQTALLMKAFADYFKLTLSWGHPFDKPFLEWAINEIHMTPDMVKYASNWWAEQTWCKDGPGTTLIKRDWLKSIAGYQETSHKSLPTRQLTREDMIDLGGV